MNNHEIHPADMCKEPGNFVTSRQALTIARDALKETQPVAAAYIDLMLNQRGCEHFDPACDGQLTDLIDIIVVG